jgi:pyridinium-3,5-biscarboxylic acid mononucleotide sulfurtransferase
MVSRVGVFRPLFAARFIWWTITRVTMTHPIETTMRRTQATVNDGSRKNSASDGFCANGTAMPVARENMGEERVPHGSRRFALEDCEDDRVKGSLRAKAARLDELVVSLERIVVAYSGGVDSSLLASVAHEQLGERTVAVTAVSPSMAVRERQAARELAERFGWNHRVVGTHEVARQEYAVNDTDRCYWCKTELFEVLGPIAAERSAVIAVGTNLDDLSDFRPGLRAATENAVSTPLVDAGLTKADVRELSAQRGLPTADKPATPCLASRFAYGVRVTPAGLRRIDAAEEAVRAHGFDVFRVRDHGDVASLEVLVEEVPRAVELQELISTELTGLGFRSVSIDPKGFRSGSQNEVLLSPTFKPVTH